MFRDSVVFLTSKRTAYIRVHLFEKAFTIRSANKPVVEGTKLAKNPYPQLS